MVFVQVYCYRSVSLGKWKLNILAQLLLTANLVVNYAN
jgi:hypothetical protein